MRLPTSNKPRVVACREDLVNYIALPRGCISEVVRLFEAHHIKPVIRDERFAGHPIVVRFSGQLRPEQLDAAAAIAEYDDGVLCAPTAFGKTALAAWMVSQRKVNTLVLVHRQQLLDQWQARLAMFLNVPAKSIGQIGGGENDPSGCVDVAIMQSSHDKAGVKDFVADYGQVIVDECHHLSAFTFEMMALAGWDRWFPCAPNCFGAIFAACISGGLCAHKVRDSLKMRWSHLCLPACANCQHP